jgi:hypothetical protein
MNIFGSQLNIVERSMLKNSTNTKRIFPEETQLIEFGLALMWDLTQVTRNAKKDFSTKPNFYANTNLFGRNRELMLYAYFCMLSSNYGTQFVILRTVLENNNLMRLFNKNPKYAYEWLPKEYQERFSSEIKQEFQGSAEKRKFSPSYVRRKIFLETQQAPVKENIEEIYDFLCNYTHPNFLGWQEIMGLQGTDEVLLELPTLTANIDDAMKMILLLIQYSFNTLVKTFKGYWLGYAFLINEWQKKFLKLANKYVK